MIAVVQLVKKAEVNIKNFSFSEIKNGLVVFLGICASDTKHDLEYMINKLIQLKIVPKKDGKFGIPVKKANLPILVVSEFTLCADIKHGSHVSFNTAMPYDKAQEVFETFVAELNKHVDTVVTGKFGADMDVTLTNTGPVTFILNSKGYKL